MMGVSGGNVPATLLISVTSSDSSIVIVGRIEAVERAISVFPAPGGPVINTLCTTDHGIQCGYLPAVMAQVCSFPMSIRARSTSIHTLAIGTGWGNPLC